jgi:squalene cyclase
MPNQSDINSAAEKVLNWLREIRNADSGWSYAQGHLSLPVETAEVLLGHADWGLDLNSPYLKPSVEYVYSWMKENATGGKDIEGVTITPRNLTWVLLLLRKTKRDQNLEAKFRSIYQGLREQGKGWMMVKGEPSNCFDTAMALIYLTQVADPSVREAYEWLQSVQGPDGGIPFHAGERPNAICTAASIIASTHMAPRPNEFINKCVDWLLKNRNSQGGWENDYEDLPYPSAEGLAHFWTHFSPGWGAMALASIGRRGPEMDGAVQHILNTQTTTGGWKGASDKPELTFCSAQGLSSMAIYLGRRLVSLG